MLGMAGRGLGVDVSAIAGAQFSGALQPSFLPQQYFQPSYMAAGSLSPLPTWLYATQAFAQQIASLLGGSVVSAPPPGNYNGLDIPNAYWVNVGGNMILPGNLLQSGTILSFPDECAAEAYFAASIPGGTESATCAAGGTGETPTQMATTPPAATQVSGNNSQPVVGTQITTTPLQTAVPVVTNTNSQTTNPGAMSTVGGGNDTVGVDQLSTSTNDLTTIATDTTFGVPNWALAGGALLLLVVIMKK